MCGGTIVLVFTQSSLFPMRTARGSLNLESILAPRRCRNSQARGPRYIVMGSHRDTTKSPEEIGQDSGFLGFSFQRQECHFGARFFNVPGVDRSAGGPGPFAVAHRSSNTGSKCQCAVQECSKKTLLQTRCARRSKTRTFCREKVNSKAAPRHNKVARGKKAVARQRQHPQETSSANPVVRKGGCWAVR